MLRALIVEDEGLMREYLAAKLTELSPAWGSVMTAADGMEAVERMAHERFDAVVTDIRMPGMDGLELARYIRRVDAELPILIISGYDAFDYARAAMRLNVFDYLLKPLNEAEARRRAGRYGRAGNAQACRGGRNGTIGCTHRRRGRAGCPPAKTEWKALRAAGPRACVRRR